MKLTTKLFIYFLLLSNLCILNAQKVSVHETDKGFLLKVDDTPFIINGMNWDYFPIGTNYEYILWNQSDEFIQMVLDVEMTLLKNMGVNSIRIYTGIQPKWIQYIYEEYGIFTMLNHSFGRYGMTIDNEWIPNTDYNNKKTRDILISETTEIAETYKNTPGLLLFLLGNENNYGLFWEGAETEDFPQGENRLNAIGEVLGRPMYNLMNDAALAMKAIDTIHPIAICNGDLMFIDIIAEECTDIDIFGVNMYRGKDFTDAFDKVKQELNMPILLTEFGSDAYNAIENKEDQDAQAFYLVNNWKDIYENTEGKGRAGNSIGGFTFQFSDGWWKCGQTINLNVHDNNASWSNEGYYLDSKKGINNMNEEWFGICAKGPTNEMGLYTLYPRVAYYALQEVHKLNPYQKEITIENIKSHFGSINLKKDLCKVKNDKKLKNEK